MTVTEWMPEALLRGGCGWYLPWEQGSHGTVGWARRGQSPEPLAVQTCPIHLQVSKRGLGLPGRWVSLRPGSLTLLQENALGKRRLLWLGMKHVCEPGAETGCSRLAPNNENASAWGKSRWQLASEEGHCDVPALPICCLAKASANLPHTALQALLCLTSQPVSGIPVSSSP